MKQHLTLSKSDAVVFLQPLDELRDTIVDFTPYFTEERFRFIDADAFINGRILAIRETPTLPQSRHTYTVVSYVWFGVVADAAELEEAGSFRVYCGTDNDGTPKEDGGPISLKVLRYLCLWASQAASPSLWLDRLCISQTSKRDKNWQIRRMYDVYEQSEQCLVLPGGLQRLTSVFEETVWAERAWTYQEAIVTWSYAVVLTRDWHRPEEEQHWHVEGECHWQYFHMLFLEGDDLLSDDAVSGQQPRLVIGRNKNSLNTLRGIVEYLTLNQVVEEGGEYINDYVIRRLVLIGVSMRTSSRPVDMVLSVLGATGVQDTFTYDIASFKQNERFRATLALVDAMFRQDVIDLEEDEASNPPYSILLDVPLWMSLKLTGAHDEMTLPSLADLTRLLDSEDAEIELTSDPTVHMKQAPLREWTFETDYDFIDESQSRAVAIAGEISETDFLKVYHGEAKRHVVRHEKEGIVELCRRLTSGEVDEEADLSDTSVFGWSLRLDGHPYIRFFKFDISYLFS
jgi:hypothetical protein